MESVFISYGGPDEEFARRIYTRLKSEGCDVFFFPETAQPGEKLHRVMRQGVNSYDKVFLICSEYSLTRRGVENELELVLAREAREGGSSVLVPIALDDYVFKEWNIEDRADIVDAVKEKVISNFFNWEEDNDVFDEGFAKLCKLLNDKDPFIFLSYSVSVQLNDVKGKNAHCVYRKQLGVNCPVVQEVTFDDLIADGVMKIDGCRGGTIVSDKIQGNVRTLTIKLDREYHRGEIIDVSILTSTYDSFLEPCEYIQQRVASCYRKMILEVESILERPIRSSCCKLTKDFKEHEIDGVEVLYGGKVARVNIPNPDVGGNFVLEWDW